MSKLAGPSLAKYILAALLLAAILVLIETGHGQDSTTILFATLFGSVIGALITNAATSDTAQRTGEKIIDHIENGNTEGNGHA